MEQHFKVYTKTGDTGRTSFIGGERVEKDDIRIESYGTLDELNSIIGVTLFYVGTPAVKTCLEKIQNDLFTLGAELASISPRAKELILPKVTPENVTEIEKQIDEFSVHLTIPRAFILPGGTQSSAFLHYTRTICRRAERVIVKLSKLYMVNPEITKYLNRLSSLLYVLARFENNELIKEQQPIYKYFEKRG